VEPSAPDTKRRILTPGRIAGVLVGLLFATIVVMFLVPSNDFLLLPDPAHPVSPLVQVQGGHQPSGPGGIYFVDVFERRASVLESILPMSILSWFHDGATRVPASDLIPPGASDQAVQQAEAREMTTSQQVAAAVALRQLGMHVVARPDGVTVAVIILGSHAAGALQPADVITSINGTPTPTIAKLRQVLAKAKVGEVVTLGVERGPKKLDLRVKTVGENGRAIVGFVPDQSAKITLPIRVAIDVGNVGGPSAGLAFALEVMEKLGRNVDRGYKVAATGQIELNGAVTPIGGVRQKIFDAREAKIDVFLVPAGDNARVAEKYAGGIRVIPVKSFQQALHALATLPPKQ
jgi:PDZ domain-containing protein